MVAADRHELGAGAHDLSWAPVNISRARLVNPADGLADVEGFAGDVAGVDDLLHREMLDVLHLVEPAQQLGGDTHVRPAEARAGTVAQVEGRPMTATSPLSASSIRGSRANIAGPLNWGP